MDFPATILCLVNVRDISRSSEECFTNVLFGYWQDYEQPLNYILETVYTYERAEAGRS